jgi:hypothetical protein
MAQADVCVLLTPRSMGGHETALFGWLAASSSFDFGDVLGMELALHSLRTPVARRQATAHAQTLLAHTHTDLRYHQALRSVTQRLQQGSVT